MKLLRLAAATLLATAAGFFIHVHYGRGWANQYVQVQAAAGRLSEIAREPYPWDVYLLALSTAVIPTAFQVLLYVLIRDKLPGRNDAIKGLWFGALLLAIGENLIRIPIMSVAVGNPIDVMLVQSAEAWTIGIVKGLLIGVVSPPLVARLSATPRSIED